MYSGLFLEMLAQSKLNEVVGAAERPTRDETSRLQPLAATFLNRMLNVVVPQKVTTGAPGGSASGQPDVPANVAIDSLQALR